MVTGQGRAEQDWNPTTVSPQHMHLLLLSKPPESLAQTEARNQDKMELWGRGYHIPTIPCFPRMQRHREVKLVCIPPKQVRNLCGEEGPSEPPLLLQGAYFGTGL